MKYQLFSKPGEVRMYFRLTDEGIDLRDGQIYWWEGDRKRHGYLKDLRKVNLKVNFGGRHNLVGIAVLLFRNGTKINIFSADPIGLHDRRRSRAYKAFVLALHEQIPEEARKRIAFVAGGTNNTAARFFGVIMLAMIGLELGAFFWNAGAMEPGHIAFLGIGGAVLVVPLYRLLAANTGETYRPHRVPSNLMP